MEGRIALDIKVGWTLCGSVNNFSVKVNKSVLITRVMGIQSEFINANNDFKRRFEKGVV